VAEAARETPTSVREQMLVVLQGLQRQTEECLEAQERVVDDAQVRASQDW
jgi:hypothetical protein